LLKLKAPYIFRYFCYILVILIFLVKTESSVYSVEHSNYYNQTKTELVVAAEPEYDFNFFKLETPLKRITDFTPTHIDLSVIYEFTHFHYNNYVLLQLKLLKRPFSPHYQLTSVLQKNNIWHQSSEEDPLLFG
jgi:hypothetical protein